MQFLAYEQMHCHLNQMCLNFQRSLLNLHCQRTLLNLPTLLTLHYLLIQMFLQFLYHLFL